jgi:hypothetical protein
MRDIFLATAMLTALTCCFAHAASTNDGIFANAALRELHKLAIASAQYEQEGDRIGLPMTNTLNRSPAWPSPNHPAMR